MVDLDIYNAPTVLDYGQSRLFPIGFFRQRYDEFASKLKTAINKTTTDLRNLEEQVLAPLLPVTKYSPVSYETLKRVTVISLCTYSGVLQSRAKARYNWLMYPLLGFAAGNLACYPKQTYYITSGVLTTALPLVASAGKASVDVGSSLFSKTSKSAYTIFERVSAAPPQEDTESGEETLYEVDVLCASEVEGVTTDTGLVTGSPQEVIGDQIMTIDQITLPTDDVPPIQGSLGMGDTEHEDMYSTRAPKL